MRRKDFKKNIQIVKACLSKKSCEGKTSKIMKHTLRAKFEGSKRNWGYLAFKNHSGKCGRGYGSEGGDIIT